MPNVVVERPRRIIGEAQRLLKPYRLARRRIGVCRKNGSLNLIEATLVIEQSHARPAAILAEEAELAIGAGKENQNSGSGGRTVEDIRLLNLFGNSGQLDWPADGRRNAKGSDKPGPLR